MTPATLRKLAEEISNIGHRWRTELDAAADAWEADRTRLLEVERAAKEWHEDKADLEACGYAEGTVGWNFISARAQTSEAALLRLVGGG